MASLFRKHLETWKEGCGSEQCEKAKHIVFARGKVPCDVLFIGEAPGESEDVIGQPFIGPAGKLLDHIIQESLGGMVWPGVSDEKGADVFVSYALTNLVGCIPREEDGGKAGEPDREQIKACAPRLIEFVRIARPRLIVLVGQLSKKNVSGQAMFSDREDMSLPWIPEGSFLRFVDITHPAAILRANVIQRGLMAQRAIVSVRNAAEEMIEGAVAMKFHP